jgi:hypothetical protein
MNLDDFIRKGLMYCALFKPISNAPTIELAM